MYGVIRRYKYDPKWNIEVNRKVYAIFVPLLRKVPGFIAYYWLNTDDGGASLSLFADKAGGEASIRAAADFVEHEMTALVGQPEVIQGEVGGQAVQIFKGVSGPATPPSSGPGSPTSGPTGG